MLSRRISIFDIVLITDRIAEYLPLQDVLTCTLVSHSWLNLFGPHRWKVVHALDILRNEEAQEALRPYSDWVRTAHLNLDTDRHLTTDFAFATWCPSVQELILSDLSPTGTKEYTMNADVLTLLDQAPKLTKLEVTWYNCCLNWTGPSPQYFKQLTLRSLELHGALTHVTLNLQYNLNAALIPQILCSLPAQIQSFKLVVYTLMFTNDWEDWEEISNLNTINYEEVLANKRHPSLTHLYLGMECSGYEHDILIPFFRTCPNIQDLYLAPLTLHLEVDDDEYEESVEDVLAQTILKHCPKITKIILAPKSDYLGLWSQVSLLLLTEIATLEHLSIEGEWGKVPPPITAAMVHKWSTSLTMLDYGSHSLVKSSDLLLVLTQCVNLLEIKTTMGCGAYDNDTSQLWTLDWEQCGVHVDELLAQPWGCLKLEHMSLILVECARSSPRVEDEARQRRIAKKVIDFHRQLKMLDSLQVLELFWYFPYLEQAGLVPVDSWCHPMGRTSKKLLARAIPKQEQSLMAIEWTEFPLVENADVDILNRGYVVTDIGRRGSCREANIWEKVQEMEDDADDDDDDDDDDVHEDEGSVEYQMYKSRLRHQRESKTKFKGLK